MTFSTLTTDVITILIPVVGFAVFVLGILNCFLPEHKQLHWSERWIHLGRALIGLIWGILYLLLAIDVIEPGIPVAKALFRPAVLLMLGITLSFMIVERGKEKHNGYSKFL